jgi:hypothetical protein
MLASVALAFTLQASALDIEAIRAKPGAHSPQYTDEDAWPALVGDEYFLKQEWSKARLLIWQPTGGAKCDPMLAENWIEAATGERATAPPDMDTDVILPDAETRYKVTGKGFVCRHLTVGRNVDFQPGGGRNTDVFGNVWIRPDGIFFVYRTLKLTGNGDTFFRRDWPADGKLKALHDSGGVVGFDPAKPKEPNPWSWRTDRRPSICHFFQHDKADKSTEFIGYSATRDEAKVASGTLIVGRDSRFLNGGAAIIEVAKAGTLALMDGAATGKTVNQFGGCLRVDGAITAGTPDRPITRDARLGVGYRRTSQSWPFMAMISQEARPMSGGSAAESAELLAYGKRGISALPSASTGYWALHSLNSRRIAPSMACNFSGWVVARFWDSARSSVSLKSS